MKRNICLVGLILSVVGCASISSVTAPNRERLAKLSLEMDKQAVIKIMGTRRMKVKTDLIHAVIINNPYRTETLNDREGKSYGVLYYATDNKTDDGLVGEADLTPLVFDSNGKLIGWGQNYLKGFIEKNQIKNTNQNAKPEKSIGFGKKKQK